MEKKNKISNTCSIHKKYRGIKRPSGDCLFCWQIWLENNPSEFLTAKDLSVILRLIRKEIDVVEESSRGSSQLASSALYVANKQGYRKF